MKITKAIIPAAGLGTRMLPASKAVPKEMLPIVDKPAIQYIVEEAAKSGITDIAIITAFGKEAMENHFDTDVMLEEKLRNGGKTDELEMLKELNEIANIYFIRQHKALGLGHAVHCAKGFVGNEPFAVMYGDDVIIGENPACKQLINAYEKYGKPVVGIKEVTDEFIVKYSSLKTEKLEDNCYSISDMIEKPTLQTKFSNYAVLGRCVLENEIFGILESIPTGVGGEIQLTDAMAKIARQKGFVGVDFTGTRYDIGNKFGFIKANIDMALQNPETAQKTKDYIKELADKL